MTEQDTKDHQADNDAKGDTRGRCGHHHHGCGSGHRCHGGRCIGKFIAMLIIFGLGFFAGHAYSCERGGPEAFMSGMPVDAERVGKFADKRLMEALDDVKANDQQKARASEIIKASLGDGIPLAEKIRDNHHQFTKLMSAATLDTTAIEALRVEQMRLVDEASRLATQTAQDVAQLLTPEQRTKLAERAGKHGGWGHRCHV
jgi:Spy/CpxP family protein refolding chaperone